jgi:hypothetical protein
VVLALGPLVLIGIVAAVAFAVSRRARTRSGVGQQPERVSTAAAPASTSRARPEPVELAVGSNIGAYLARWVDAKLLSDEQSVAILAYERSRATQPGTPAASVRSPRRIPAVAEALGYLGGILAIVGLVLVVARYWSDMATFGKLALCGAAALVLFGAGAVVREQSDPAFARLRGFLWLTSTAASALFVGVMVHDSFGVTKQETIVLACAGAVALQSGLLWWGRERPLQQLAFLIGAVVTMAAAVAELAHEGPVGLTVWIVGVLYLASGVTRRTTTPLLTEAVGAVAVVVGAVITASGWQAFGLAFAVTTAFALLALAAVPGLVPARADELLLAVVGSVALLQTGPATVGYFARDAGLAAGLTVWIIGSGLLFVGARRLVRLPDVIEVLGGIAMLAGAAITGIQSTGFAPLFGIVTALGLVGLGMLPGQVLLSVLGSVGLLINVPWAIGWFFPGEGRAPLLIFVSGALILTVAVLLTRERGRFRHELTRPTDKT